MEELRAEVASLREQLERSEAAREALQDRVHALQMELLVARADGAKDEAAGDALAPPQTSPSQQQHKRRSTSMVIKRTNTDPLSAEATVRAVAADDDDDLDISDYVSNSVTAAVSSRGEAPAYTEDVLQNPFYKVLATRFPELFYAATTGGFVICVPHVGLARSIQLEIDHKLVEDHLLQPPPDGGDGQEPVLYRAVGGRQVRLADGQLTLVREDDDDDDDGDGDGEDNGRKKAGDGAAPVKLLFREQLYTEDCHPYQVLCLDHVISDIHFDRVPLDAPVQPLTELEIFEQGLEMFQHRSAAADVKRLIRLTQDSSVAKTRVMLRKYADSSVPSTNERRFVLLTQALQACVFRETYPRLFARLRTRHVVADGGVSSVITSLNGRGLRLTDLGVPDHLDCGFAEAICELQNLNARYCAFEKLICIRRAIDLICARAREFQRLRKIDAEPIAADDMLPIVVYCIVRARVGFVYTNLAFIYEFEMDVLSTLPELGYNLATFEAACEFLSGGGDLIGRMVRQ